MLEVGGGQSGRNKLKESLDAQPRCLEKREEVQGWLGFYDPFLLPLPNTPSRKKKKEEKGQNRNSSWLKTRASRDASLIALHGADLRNPVWKRWGHRGRYSGHGKTVLRPYAAQGNPPCMNKAMEVGCWMRAISTGFLTSCRGWSRKKSTSV